MDDSVFERPSIRLASFVGVTDGDEANMADKSSETFRLFEGPSTESFRFALGLLPYVCMSVVPVSGVSGRSVTCSNKRVTIQRCSWTAFKRVSTPSENQSA